MVKFIHLACSRIKYTGDSIGDDIRIEITCQDSFLGLDKRIKRGGEVAVNTTIGQFSTDQTEFSLPVTIRIIERDLIFNDVGSKEFKLKINLTATAPQVSIHEIVVREQRGLMPGSRTAVFSITLEALAGQVIRYIPITDDGWFVCNRENKKTPVALPAYVKVRFDRIESGREYFSVAEGAWQGVQLWVSAKRDVSLQLLSENPQTDGIQLSYSISKKTLVVSNKTYETTDSPDAPWKKGRYDVEIPDAPHRGGLNYPDANYARVWFRVGHSGDRYLHTGRHSLGCITVIEQDQWDALCALLLKARKGDGKSVGVLTVTD